VPFAGGIRERFSMLSPTTPRPISSGSPEPLDLRLGAGPESVTRARTKAADYAAAVGAEREPVELAVAEAVGNAVLHAFQNDEEGTIRVHAEVVADQLVIEISDDGTGIQPDPEARRAGLGLPIIGGLGERMEIHSGVSGTSVSVRFPLAEH
jgi:stage II sporulation protein AB (anti-sigma F factor)